MEMELAENFSHANQFNPKKSKNKLTSKQNNTTYQTNKKTPILDKKSM